MELGLSGKTAVITGGASGLGLETARYLTREGARVVLADVQAENLKKAVDEIAGMGGHAEGVITDVRDYAACERMAAVAKAKFGAVDFLLGGAGISQTQFFLEAPIEDWNRMIDINVRGLLNTNRAIAPLMAEQRRGSIVNIASEAGKVGEKRLAAYSATKGAVISFSKAFAIEMGRYGVRVNAVCPGVTMTPMTTGYGSPDSERYKAAAKLYPLGRLGEAQDIAAMITFLASDQASWVTGQAISVNGGFGRS